ncbi:M23 family metallopeptidase [Paenibacillus sp. FA6]|uniref:M23 family metallopeptidase n=1 Tax=Paenibacillus sp. FA6 TaxID=3413029 RepID=UPI003F65CB2B
MKSTKTKQPLTLLVLRDAQHSVKQIHISKPLLIIVPTVAILSLTGLIISMQVHSSQAISKMEQEMNLQNIANHQMEITVSNREEAISRLQNEIIQLSTDAHDMKDKMQRVSELEEELQTFIKKNDTSMIPDEVSSKSPTTNLANDLSTHVGGEFIAVQTSDIIDLSQETKDDFEEIRKLIHSMENNIPRTLEKAQATQDMLAGIPNMWPTSSHVISSSFGYRKDPFTRGAAYHAGIDISGNTGDPVYAAGAGKVLHAEQLGARGLYIQIEHPNGLQTSYMHLSKIEVAVGDLISKGEVIGKLGNTGRSTGAHLHFQVEKKNKAVNPLPYIK